MLAIVVGVRCHRPSHAVVWWFVAAGQFASATADLTFFLEHLVLGHDMFPSVADVFYLAEYPLAAAGWR